jgi:subtilisin-like proprotein convertase family protein
MAAEIQVDKSARHQDDEYESYQDAGAHRSGSLWGQAA